MFTTHILSYKTQQNKIKKASCGLYRSAWIKLWHNLSLCHTLPDNIQGLPTRLRATKSLQRSNALRFNSAILYEMASETGLEIQWGMKWREWLYHEATSRTVSTPMVNGLSYSALRTTKRQTEFPIQKHNNWPGTKQASQVVCNGLLEELYQTGDKWYILSVLWLRLQRISVHWKLWKVLTWCQLKYLDQLIKYVTFVNMEWSSK